MNYYHAPEHIAEPYTKDNVIPYLEIFFSCAMAFGGLSLITQGYVFLGIVTWTILVAFVCLKIFGFKYCPGCSEIKIPRSKKYCYACWERAMKSPDDPSNQAILNP